jgi:hypothetical protein
MCHVSRRGLGAMLVGAAMLATIAAGCAAGRATQRSGVPVRLAATSTSAVSSAEATSLAGTVEVRQLLARFNQPEEAGDPGYELLGPEHNDIAAWTREVVLAHTEYARFVRSLATQQGGIPSTALTAFGRTLASKGATATYDAIISSQWRLENGGSTRADKAIVTLIPASTALGLLFDRQGRLLETYEPKKLTILGTTAEATYSKPAEPDVVLEFELNRDATGDLRLVGWKNYAQFKTALRGNEIVDGLP